MLVSPATVLMGDFQGYIFLQGSQKRIRDVCVSWNAETVPLLFQLYSQCRKDSMPDAWHIFSCVKEITKVSVIYSFQ